MAPINQGPATVAYLVQSQPPYGIVGYSTVPGDNGSQVSNLTLPTPYAAGLVATDSVGQIYVAAGGIGPNMQIFVYPPNSNGAATPSRSFAIDVNPSGLAVDPAGAIYMTTQQSAGATPTIFVYSSTATGNASPIRTFQPSSFLDVQQITFDRAGNIYVAGAYGPNADGIIGVYQPLSTGVVTPVRAITFKSYAIVYGIAVDSAGNIFANVCPQCTGTNFVIEKFAAGANGIATPTNTIELPLGPSGYAISGGPVYVDGIGNVFTSLTPTFDSHGNLNYVLYGFSPGASGSVQPDFQLTNNRTNVNGFGFAIN